MAIWFLFLVSFLAIGVESQTAYPMNQTDLQIAMDDMRSSSYNGFVILLKLISASANSLQNGEITFLMPTDQELAKAALRPDSLRELVLSHSIPSALLISHLLHFPNGSLVPSSIPNRMLRITRSKKSGLFLNNARILTPNVCLNSLIRCHGISTTMTFDKTQYSAGTQHQHQNPLLQRFIGSEDARKKAKSSSSVVDTPH
ncbi:Fasciclin-like arabinogalactan family protein [Euphorbia peplus]|nr:Fasciclin-like arabinogalactan family protein [Euphorbia peplus]